MQDQEMIQAFSPHASQKAFTDGIGSWRPVRRLKHFDTTCCCHSCKMLPEFAIIIPDQIFWGLSIRSGLPQLLRDPGIGGRACHIDMDDLPRLQFDDEEGKERTEEEIRDLQENHRPRSLPHDCAGTFSSSVHGLVVGRICFIYFWMVRLLTRISSLRSSPRMRSAPQSRLLAAISLINVIVSCESLGLLERAFDLCFQNTRKSSRCQRRSVSGCTIKSACFQVRTILARNTRSTRSVFWYTGRLICRRKMISWCRNSAFSASSSALPLVRSANIPSTREVVSGLIQRETRSWSA